MDGRPGYRGHPPSPPVLDRRDAPGGTGAPASTEVRSAHEKGRAFLPALNRCESPLLDFQNSHDLEGVRIHDHDLLLDEDEFIAAPFRIDRHHSLRQRMEGHVTRNAGADRNREVHVRNRLNALLPDHGRDLGALLGRELRGRAGLARRGRALACGAALCLRLHAVLLTLSLLITARRRALITLLGRGLVTTRGRGLVTMLGRALIMLRRALAGRLPLLLGLHAAAVFLTLGLHVLVMPAFAAFGLHVLAALHVVFGALVLFSTRRLLL